MSALKHWAGWLIPNALFAAFLVFATWGGNKGCENVLTFAIPVLCMASFFGRPRSDSPVPYWLDVAYDVAFLVVLAWHGWFVLGALYAIHTLQIATKRGAS